VLVNKLTSHLSATCEMKKTFTQVVVGRPCLLDDDVACPRGDEEHVIVPHLQVVPVKHPLNGLAAGSVPTTLTTLVLPRSRTQHVVTTNGLKCFRTIIFRNSKKCLRAFRNHFQKFVSEQESFSKIDFRTGII
jgi:hypothetical protein